MRQFKTGATRDSNKGKNDYEGFLSPLFIEAFGNYMTRHQKQADGKMRDSDNWQNYFGKNHYKICIKSLFRHFIDFWCIHRGYTRYDKDDKHKLTKIECICAIFFNLQAYADKLLNEKEENNNVV